MSNWLDRSGYMTVLAFAGGAAIAVIVIVVILFVMNGGDDDSEDPTPTATEAATPGTPTPNADQTPTVAVSATPSVTFDNPDDAIAALVTGELNETFIGACPPTAPSGEAPPAGICSVELYRSTELATFNLGPFGSEALGEAVVVPDENGRWSLSFYEFPPLDAAITVGATAMVFQAENCLNFRSAPSATAEVLSCQIDGTSAEVVEGPTQAGNESWWRLEDYGWAAERYLAPVQ